MLKLIFTINMLLSAPQAPAPNDLLTWVQCSPGGPIVERSKDYLPMEGIG